MRYYAYHDPEYNDDVELDDNEPEFNEPDDADFDDPADDYIMTDAENRGLL